MLNRTDTAVRLPMLTTNNGVMAKLSSLALKLLVKRLSGISSMRRINQLSRQSGNLRPSTSSAAWWQLCVKTVAGGYYLIRQWRSIRNDGVY